MLVTVFRGHRKRVLVTSTIVVAVLLLFTWEWTNAPRVDITPAVAAQLERAPASSRYLGKTFEGLPLRRVEPFVYSDCVPGEPHQTPCHWLRVSGGRITGSDAAQVRRAMKALRPLSSS